MKQLSASPLATLGWPIGPTSQPSRSSGYGPGNGRFPCRKGHGTAHAASLKSTAHGYYRWCQSDAALSPRFSRRTVFCHFVARSITASSSADTTTTVNRAVDRHVRGCHVCTETRTRPRHPHIIIYPCASTSTACQASRANKPRTGVRKDGEAQCPAMC